MIKELEKATIINCGCDYMSCSTSDTSLADFCEHKMRLGMYKQNPTAWEMLGYRGLAIEGLRFGISKDGASFAQLSGGYALRHWTEFVPEVENISRLDAQITFRTPEYQPTVARSFYKIVQAHQETITSKSGPIKQPALKLILGNGDGDTFYIGRRSSAQMGRIYDKEKEKIGEPAYKNTWRFEVEFKNELAKLATSSIMASSHKTHYAIAKMVMLWYAKRGVYFKIPEIDCNWVDLPITYSPSDVETQLNWLRNQVRPTVIKLLAGGYVDSIIDSLCLELFYPQLQEYTLI